MQNLICQWAHNIYITQVTVIIMDLQVTKKIFVRKHGGFYFIVFHV